MDDPAVKATRHTLRLIQDHWFYAVTAAGAKHDTVGFIDVVYHPNNALPEYNFVTPRRNTAWVSGQYVAQGLERLTAVGRVARVRYIEGLYPPLFAKTIRTLGLEIENEIPLMVYQQGGLNGVVPPPPPSAHPPEQVRLELVTDQAAAETWWYVWRNAYYDCNTPHGADQALVRGELEAIRKGGQLNIIVYRHNFPVGAARLSVHMVTKSAQITALALVSDARTRDLTRLLLSAAMRAALARGCSLVFTAGETDADRQLCRELGFIDLGGIVSYAAVQRSGVSEDNLDAGVAQPVYSIKR